MSSLNSRKPRLTRIVRSVSSDWKCKGRVETYAFPEDWTIHEYRLPEVPALPGAQIRARLEDAFPFKDGTATMAELAKKSRKIVVLVDDLTRITPAYAVLPHMLGIFHRAGVSKEQINIICAVGSHRPLTRKEQALKVGDDVAADYHVENHDCFDANAVHLGDTPYGTPVKLNRKVVEADLVVGVGTTVKHAFAYASGGSKIILPGVAHIDSIAHNHSHAAAQGLPGEEQYGMFRVGMDEAARLLADNTALLVANITINRNREVTGIFLGECVRAFRENVDAALEAYEIEFDASVYGENGKADIGVFRMDTLDGVQIGRALNDWSDYCRVPVFTGNFMDKYIYQGLRWGPHDAFLEMTKTTEKMPNPPMAEALAGKNVFVCSPELDIDNARTWDSRFFVMNDWEQFIRQLYQHLGGGKTVAFCHDGYLQRLRIRNREK